jgi:hypothetical protein
MNFLIGSMPQVPLPIDIFPCVHRQRAVCTTCYSLLLPPEATNKACNMITREVNLAFSLVKSGPLEHKGIASDEDPIIDGTAKILP